MKDSRLYKKIISHWNIYNAIFGLESYVFEKGLLDTNDSVYYVDPESGEILIIAKNDLELFYALADKHNEDLITKVISICEQRLKDLFESKSDLFKIKVYFKLKNYDDKILKFRPIHTARLTDMICMVSILNCLMFEDDEDTYERHLSVLSKLIPHNFYGNIPSTNIQNLFHKWQSKYSEYTQDVIEHCREYQENHNYLTEVCLDIKNFFPTISPKMLFNYIIGKLSATFNDDLYALKMAVSKLLYFKVVEENIEPWKTNYYPKDFVTTPGGLYMNCGIPQGLPQSYFFGNLCMIEIKNVMMDKKHFNGDAYFYVDDSVIYLQTIMEANKFEDKIKNLNSDLERKCEEIEGYDKKIESVVPMEYLDFHEKLQYRIKFHETGKSVCTPIDETNNQFGFVSFLSKRTSCVGSLSCNLDEIDDEVSKEKLKAYDNLIISEISELKDNLEKCGVKEEEKKKITTQLKLLKRFRKFFLYRYRLLKMREDGEPKKEDYDKYKNAYLNTKVNLDKWFEKVDEDIFQSEYRLIIQKETMEFARIVSEDVKNFELAALYAGGYDVDRREPYLYYKQDADSTLRMKSLTQDSYASLKRWAKSELSGRQGLASKKQRECFRNFILTNNSFSFEEMRENGFCGMPYTKFAINASSEFQRRIVNVVFSEIMSVIPSDALTFNKSNLRKFCYYEVRNLAYLRNRNFNIQDFKDFFSEMKDNDISDSMGIDMGLLDVLNKFITKVRKPEWVDCLIQTHRLTKGLWYNGSKFLNSYTLHNEEHAVTLINKSLEILNRIDYFALKNVDYYILFLSCYLHDISMVIHPEMGKMSSVDDNSAAVISEVMMRMQAEVEKFSKIQENDTKNSRVKDAGKFLVEVFEKVYSYFENIVRTNHPKDSATFILKENGSMLSYLEEPFLSFVAKVSESHGYDVLDVYGLKSRAKDDTVSLKYLMILIRLADLLDVANDRVNYHLLTQNLKYLSQVSRFHWISHLVTDKIEVRTKYYSIINKDEERKEEEACLDSRKILIEEILNLNLYLNVKYMTAEKNERHCESCSCKIDEGYIRINIKSGHYPRYKCEENDCTFLCSWMMKKHEMLINELVALNDYLSSVNSKYIKTSINLNIYYSNDMNLAPVMFDSVQDYLK